VNANVFLALRGTHLEGFANYDMLRQAQDERGFWRSYFYPSPLFGTLLALDALHGNPAFADATKRALAFIVGSQNADGSWGADGDPYETALAVAALAEHQAHAAATRRGVEHLLASMAADGSWTSRACVWEFHSDERDVWRAYDTHRAYVSARCTSALHDRAAASRYAVTGLPISPSSVPTFSNAASAVSISARVRALEIWQRTRAVPSGTTG
jgi:hypothetical protein